MNADDYTADSYAKLKEALDAARKVMQNSAATQEQIDAARSALESAMQGLVKKEETPQTDTSALSSALNSAQGY
ncbi:FIVAR domain-containing protein, partial [Desulfovibrio desulfuricans]